MIYRQGEMTMNPILTFNVVGEDIEQRMRSTLQSFGGIKASPTQLREVQAKAEQIVKDVLWQRVHLPDATLVTLIWSEASHSVMIMFHPFVLANITEPIG